MSQICFTQYLPLRTLSLTLSQICNAVQCMVNDLADDTDEILTEPSPCLFNVYSCSTIIIQNTGSSKDHHGHGVPLNFSCWFDPYGVFP